MNRSVSWCGVETLGGGGTYLEIAERWIASMASSSAPGSQRIDGAYRQSQHPEVQRAIETAARHIARQAKRSGILTTVEADARRYIEWGFRFVAVGTDIGLLAKHADALAAAFKAR